MYDCVTILSPGICPTLQNPTNGNVEMTNNTVGSIATYSCQTNYTLIGPSERNCTAEVGWSGEDPLCRKSNNPLLILIRVLKAVSLSVNFPLSSNLILRIFYPSKS